MTTPVIHTRGEWGAAPFRGTPIPQPRHERIVVHHSVGRHPWGLAGAAAEMRSIQVDHQKGRGWPDIGYQFCIAPSGEIIQGLPYAKDGPLEGLVIGTHVANKNTGSIGICLLGNYDRAEPVEPLLRSLVELCAYLCEGYAIDPAEIYGHGQFAATACPGEHVNDQMARVIQDVRTRLSDRASTGIEALVARVKADQARLDASIRELLRSI